jgi:predicted dehydrogenase
LKQVLIRRGSPIVADVPAPQLADRTILVEVAYSLVSTGTEQASIAAGGKSLLRRAYEQPSNIARGLQMVREIGFQRTMSLVSGEMDASYATGYSCSGVVLACGRNTTGFAPGDRVACAGASLANHAELVAIPQNLAVRIPEGCDLESAASATVGAIALQGIRRADLRLGETAAVIGLGLVGQVTVQLLRAAGCRTIGADIDPGRVALAAACGMTQQMESDSAAALRNVMDFTQGAGVDAVIVTASSQSPDILQQAMKMVRKKGKVVVVGVVPLQVDRSPFYEKEADLLISCSYGPGRYDPEYEERGLDYPHAYVRWSENRNMSEYLQLIAEGKVDFRKLVGKVWPLAEAPQAYASLQQHIAVLLSYNRDGAAATSEPRVTFKPKAIPKGSVIRTGIVGAGSFARAVHLPNLKQLEKSFNISAVACRTGVSATNTAQQFGAGYATTAAAELFDNPDIDLVLISSRHNLHAKLAAEAAAHGKSVLLEKPAAMNRDELQQLINAFRNSQTMLVVGFNRRFSPLIREVKTNLERRSGPVVITYRMNAGHIPNDSWVHGPEGGGRIIGEACHVFDLFNYLIGKFPEEVTALPLQPGASHIAPTDNFTAVLRYAGGSLCTLTYTSLGSSELPKESMEVFFDGKSIVLDDFRKLGKYGFAGGNTAGAARQEKGHIEELQAIADHLLNGGPPPMTLDEIESATNISFVVDELVRSNSACVES